MRRFSVSRSDVILSDAKDPRLPADSRDTDSSPSAQSDRRSKGWERYEAPAALALSGALVWIAQFQHFRDFGLYEDDYWFISEAMGKDPS